jgi:hypothetical protein
MAVSRRGLFKLIGLAVCSAIAPFSWGKSRDGLKEAASRFYSMGWPTLKTQAPSLVYFSRKELDLMKTQLPFPDEIHPLPVNQGKQIHFYTYELQTSKEEV